MANTTISVSKRFRDWLKSKGLKGESYEEVMQKLINPEALEEYKATSSEQTSSNKKEAKEQSDVVDEIFEGKLT